MKKLLKHVVDNADFLNLEKGDTEVLTNKSKTILARLTDSGMNVIEVSTRELEKFKSAVYDECYEAIKEMDEDSLKTIQYDNEIEGETTLFAECTINCNKVQVITDCVGYKEIIMNAEVNVQLDVIDSNNAEFTMFYKLEIEVD